MFNDKSKETAWLKASQQGNAQAFEGLVRQYQSLVCAITYSATGNVVQSEELAQDIFLKAWKNLNQLHDVSKFRSWLRRIANTTVQNWFRSQKRDTAAQATPLEAACDTPSMEPGPVEVTMRHEHEALVSQAMSQLPVPQRLVLVLFYREHQSVREVARQLDISETTARQRISRARKMIRDNVQSIIEQTLAHTRPDKAFTTAVIASVTALAVPSTLTQAATVQATATVGSQLATTGLFSGMVAKICCVAGGLVIIVGGVTAFKRSASPAIEQEPSTKIQSVLNESVQVEPEPEMGLMAVQQADITPNVQGSTDTSLPRIMSPTVASPQATHKPYVFTAHGVLSGLITDSQTGDPIPDILVRISGMKQGNKALTDANGFYSFETVQQPGHFRINLDGYPDYVSNPWPAGEATLQLDPTQQVVKHFELDQACQVAITVVDSNDMGIAEADVIATSLTDLSCAIVANFGAFDRNTDPNGFLLYGGFPPAETDYLITVYHWHNRELDYAPARALVHLTDPNEVTSVTITLEKGQEVHGYVEYKDGTPATDIKISARPSWWHCNRGVNSYPVNEDGTFSFRHIVPGDYDVCVRYPDKVGTIPLLSKVRLPLPKEEPLAVILPDKSAQSLASISGTLQILGGETPDYVEINALNLKTHKQETFMLSKKADGHFPDTFVLNRLQSSKYLLRFYAGPKFEDKIIREVEAPCSDLLVEVMSLDMIPPKLTGTVLDQQTGKPINQFKLRVLCVSRSNYSTDRHQWIDFNNQQGEFQWEVKRPGVYSVQVDADGYAPAWSHEINTDNDEPFLIHLSSGGTLKGTVVDESGKKLNGAKVIPLSLACGATPDTQSIFVSEQGAVETTEGAFILKHLPPGQEILKISYPDHAFSYIDKIDIVEGQTTQGIEIVVRPGGTIEGIVYDDEGFAQANQVLNVRIGNQFLDFFDEPLASVITDSNGFYRIEHMPNLVCVVHRAVPWTMLGVIVQTLVPENGQVHNLDFGGTPLAHGFIVIDDEPLTNHMLSIGDKFSAYRGEFTCKTRTDEFGNFTFRGVCPGIHTIYYKHPVREKEWIKLTSFAMGSHDLDLGGIQTTIARHGVSKDRGITRNCLISAKQ